MMFLNNWFDFATDDIKAGEILLREEVFNMACFHFQQAAEKTLKGFVDAIERIDKKLFERSDNR